MNIVILGAGDTAAYLAAVLSQEEHSVIVIDKDGKKLDRLSKEADISTKTILGSEWKVLDLLTESNPDFFLALTETDETNLTACLLAKNLGYPNTICRISQMDYLEKGKLDFGRLFYVDYFIGAETIAAQEIVKMLISAGDLLTEDFAHGAVQLRSIQIPENWNRASTLIQDLQFPEEFIIGLIRREERGKKTVLFPHGNDVILPKDIVTVVGKSSSMGLIHQFFGIEEKTISSCTIAGGSSVAIHLAHLLQELGISIKIIEKEESICSFLADLFPEATIINHDSKDLEFLKSEKIASSPAFIALTHHDEENLFIASVAKEAGCKRVISLISDTSLVPVLEKLEVSFASSAKMHIANRILSIIHSKTILSLSSLFDEETKVVEMKVSPESQLIGLPLSDLSSYLPKDLIIAIIENRGKVMIGKGDRILSPNDIVILITKKEHIHDLKHLF